MTRTVSDQPVVVDAVSNAPIVIGSGSDQPKIVDAVLDQQTVIDVSNGIMNPIKRDYNDDIVIESEVLSVLLRPNDVLEVQIPDCGIDSVTEVKDGRSTQDEEAPRRFRKRVPNEFLAMK